MDFVNVIDDNQEALLWRLRMIGSAKKKIVMIAFKMRVDESGSAVIAALAAAAMRGVEIYILIDSISSNFHCAVSGELAWLTSFNNVHFCFYNPVLQSNPIRITFRLHDKILLIDDDIYMIGGRNVLDESLSKKVQKYNVDRDVVVIRDQKDAGSVDQIVAYVHSLWECSAVKKYHRDPGEKVKQEARISLEARYEQLKKEYPFITQELNQASCAEFIPVSEISLIHGDPASRFKGLEIYSSLIRIMKRGEDVLIQTPYIMCNDLMYQGLEEVVQAVQNFRILTNAPVSGANYFGSADIMNKRKEIFRHGIKVYECVGEHSLHTKSIMIDRDISIIGSFNFDMRSAYMDTEIMLMIRSEELNQKLRERAEALIRKSRSLDETGHFVYGENYRKKHFNPKQIVIYGFLRVAIRPFRFLL